MSAMESHILQST